MADLQKLFRRHVLVVLQNAYARGSLKKGYNYHRWFREFRETRTGRRLAEIFSRTDPYGLEGPRYVNAAPGLGDGPASKLPACCKYLQTRVKAVQPRLLLACGKLAETACLSFIGTLDVWVIPHPASRVLTSDLLARVGWLLEWRMSVLEDAVYVGLAPVLVQGKAPLTLTFRQHRDGFTIEKAGVLMEKVELHGEKHNERRGDGSHPGMG